MDATGISRPGGHRAAAIGDGAMGQACIAFIDDDACDAFDAQRGDFDGRAADKAGEGQIVRPP